MEGVEFTANFCVALDKPVQLDFAGCSIALLVGVGAAPSLSPTYTICSPFKSIAKAFT